tara:strand:- start:5108 stop:5509 length:402 start_codon:yes stop_codon:yes gene_type:complete
MKKQTFDYSCNILLEPVPASRPKVSRFGTYYGKRYAKWKNDADKLLRQQSFPSTDKPLSVNVEQVCKKPKTTKRSYPTGDVDNHCKGPLDAITRSNFGWDDDSQIVELKVFKRYAEQDEQPKSIIQWKAIQNL